ncbi:hypothetical protein ACH5RR_026727 [Cinchona calisaya]|uniref:Uncharacterized protein n=1 Tax=Cinchona calisaya TaxID=153742 RepID=A0ABD2Z3E9_9GENT
MENIHLLIEDTLSYLIHLEDGCSDPDMKDNIAALRLLISILKPFLRFLIYGYVPEVHQLPEFRVHLVYRGCSTKVEECPNRLTATQQSQCLTQPKCGGLAKSSRSDASSSVSNMSRFRLVLVASTPILTRPNLGTLSLTEVYDEAESVSTRFKLPANSCNMEEHIPGFTGYLIHKVRELSNNMANFMVIEVKTQIDILVDELSFMIDTSLVDMLFKCPLFGKQYMIDSIEVLIFQTGFFIYFSLDKNEDEEFIMANYLSSALPDLLNHADIVHQQARAEFQEYFL